MLGYLPLQLTLLQYSDPVLLGPSEQRLMRLTAPILQIQLARRCELPQLRDSKRLTKLVASRGNHDGQPGTTRRQIVQGSDGLSDRSNAVLTQRAARLRRPVEPCVADLH